MADLVTEGPPAPVAIEITSATPMMRQYLETKAKYPDAILFFRLGDFYEMFFEDALRASEILQITLTGRTQGDERIPMCGVPHHASKGYIAKLVEHGLKVAICEQVEQANGPKLVKREVTRVVTPGMVLDDDAADARESRYLATVRFGEREAGLALLDASTGDFRAGTVALALLGEELARAAPREVVVAGDQLGRDELKRAGAPVHVLQADAFDTGRATALLRAHFGVASLDGFGLEDAPLAAAAAGAALRYVQETQKAKPMHIDRLCALTSGSCLVLDESSRANLEVLRSLREGKRAGSLLGLLDRTATVLGGRALARWLTEPLWDLAAIRSRHDAVEEFTERVVLRDEVVGLLREVADIERLTSRLTLGQGNARDMAALGRSLAQLPRLAERASACRSELLRAAAAPLSKLPDLAVMMQRAIVDEPPATTLEGGMVRRGWNANLDKLLEVSTQGKDFLLRLEARERERTKIGSLKIRYNSVFHYYIEVTKPNLHLVPKDYQRKQTTVGAERFITEELKQHEEQVLGAEEKRVALEKEIFEELRRQVISRASKLREAAEALATLDVLAALARCATDYGYVRPDIDDSDVIEITEGRHPVIERLLSQDAFVPNDVNLDCSGAQMLVITGPNMAGKSTVMRQVALMTLMAQAGSFVPARKARIGRVDRIFTRVGARDNLARGQSTFMVEMTETANILHNATRRSLIILDEIGRGTSTFDGLSIAWAVAEHLHDNVGARTLFATHYHELTELNRERRRVRNVSIAVKEWQGQVIFLRKLVEGGASRSYGIEVAKLAGLPTSVLQRARLILQNLESGEVDEAGQPRVTRASPHGKVRQLTMLEVSSPPEAQPLAAAETPIERELRELAIDSMTPLDALNLLARWKKQGHA